MESEIPMILPKGIVVNTENVYDEIASHRQVPFDRVWQVWRVYTITNRKLQDPTARRLENFWWHVMGSDRRLLSGEMLASLYEDISLGPTFLPLKGPSNRWDGDDPPVSAQHIISILESEKARLQPLSETSLIDKPSHSDTRGLSASAAKPPPSHPILKKPRGPSASGPRPTARFVSPPVSGGEDDQEGGTSSSGSTITPALEMRGPRVSPPKKKTVSKKFVASKASAKRRPILPRKTSSQSSVIVDQGSKGSAPSVISRSNERGKGDDASPGDAHNASRSLNETDEPGKMSSKAAGKRPMVPVIYPPKIMNNLPEAVGTASTADSSLPTNRMTMSSEERANRLFSKSPSSKPQRAQSSIDLTRQPLGISVRKNPPGPWGPATAQYKSVPMAKSRSHSGSQPLNSNTARKGLPQTLFTEATSSTTNVAAKGVIIDQSGTFDSSSSITPGFFDQVDLGARSGSLSSSILEPRLVPTPPSTSASVPLGRTRSQLTLLLEREKTARGGANLRSKS